MALFNCSILLDAFNDDVLRIILSFLHQYDLLQLEIVSKHLRICQLCSEDQYWKEFCVDHVRMLKQEYDNLHNRVFKGDTSEPIRNLLKKYDEILTLLERDFKKQLVEVWRMIHRMAEMENSRIIGKIDVMKPLTGRYPFIPITEIRKYKLKTEINGVPSYKITQIGDGAVGKTCLFIRMAVNTFPDEYIPTVFDSYSGNFICEEKTFNLSLFDTSGDSGDDYHERRMFLFYYGDTRLFLLSFSCISIISLENTIDKWVPRVRQQYPSIPIALVCTKIDVRSNIDFSKRLLRSRFVKPFTYDIGESLAKKLGCIAYLETSALTSVGMDHFPTDIIKIINISQDEKYLKKKRKDCFLQ